MIQAVSEQTPVLYVVYDIEARGPLASMAPSKGLLGGALVLNSEQTAQSKARLTWGVREEPGVAHTAARPENAALVDGNAMASCLAFFETLADSSGREIVQTLSARLALALKPQAV
jgi:hypothetical protein